jgi:coenzyme PQQ precursor peptide PqqA
LILAIVPRSAKEDNMSWKTPKIAEVSVGMEINMYACAWRAPKVSEVSVGMEINMYACATRK